MISGLPGIIVVDDNDKELDDIKNAFFESGIPCLPIKYINDDPDNDSGIDHVDISNWVSPRILVSDLNLTEMQNSSAVNLAGPFAQMLKKLSIKGPYLLCLWSKLESEVSSVVQILEERYSEDIVLPIQVCVISKSEFLSEPEMLRNKLKNIISESPLFETLLNWEIRISEAARNTTNALSLLAKESVQTASIEDHASELRKILAVIGNEAIGLRNAVDNPSLAMDYGLIPVLEDQVRSMTEADLNDKWKIAVPEIGQRQNIDDSVKSILNAFYHLEEVDIGFSKSNRGVFVSLNNEYLNEEECLKKFEARIGRNIKSLIHDEFLPNTFNSSQKKLRDEARSEIMLGFLEISPACDFAQRKIKLHRYILGALIPEKFEELTTWKTVSHGVKDKAHEGIHRLPRLRYRGKSYILKLSFKYQLGAQPEDNQWFGDSLFRVRDQVLSSIIYNCSQYSSRPGVISFY